MEMARVETARSAARPAAAGTRGRVTSEDAKYAERKQATGSDFRVFRIFRGSADLRANDPNSKPNITAPILASGGRKLRPANCGCRLLFGPARACNFTKDAASVTA